MSRLRFIPVTILLCFLSMSAQSDDIRLHVPIVVESPKLHQYFHELLLSALLEAGHSPELIVGEYPQLRVKKYLESGELSIYWMLESRHRNESFASIDVDLTNGLIGKRVLFIRAGEQHRYDSVQTVADFRALNLVGGMGKNWFDVDVWKANQLNYLEFSGNWESIFKMVALGRSFNYFSRGVTEILAESAQYPDLEIERNLLLCYDRDFHFYLSTTGKHAGLRYQKQLKEAIQKAQESGLIDRLVREYWEKDFETLNYDQRRRIKLITPG